MNFLPAISLIPGSEIAVFIPNVFQFRRRVIGLRAINGIWNSGHARELPSGAFENVWPPQTAIPPGNTRPWRPASRCCASVAIRHPEGVGDVLGKGVGSHPSGAAESNRVYARPQWRQEEVVPIRNHRKVGPSGKGHTE